jgi:hypothetical protein
VTGQADRNITYEYTNTCCFDTGLASDCTIPANTTESCIGIHETSDVTGLVVDFGVEFGITMISLVGIIVLVGLVVWFRPRVGKLV